MSLSLSGAVSFPAAAAGWYSNRRVPSARGLLATALVRQRQCGTPKALPPPPPLGPSQRRTSSSSSSSGQNAAVAQQDTSATSPRVNSVRDVPADHEVPASDFLSAHASEEALFRGQGLPITSGRLPTFLAPTTVAPGRTAADTTKEPPAQPKIEFVGDGVADAFLEALQELAEVTGDVSDGEPAEVYKARADAFGQLGSESALRWRQIHEEP